MSIEAYLDEMKDIEISLLIFLEEEDNAESNIQNLKEKFDKIKIYEDQHTLMSFLNLLTKIANNHHHCPNFFDRINQILQIFASVIKKYYTNSEIFNIFKNNKRILLFLFEQKIVIIDKYIAKKFVTIDEYINDYYPLYFKEELKSFRNEKWFPKNEDKQSPDSTSENEENWIDQINKEELLENYHENRRIGENECHICKLIRDDDVVEFIKYVNKNKISLMSTIPSSIYETNSFLLKANRVTLIEYAAFFGSVQIFQYLQINGVELTQSLWLFVIHSQNPELIHRLEENRIIPSGSKNEIVSYVECYKESIKCHHNDVANYIQNNLLQNGEENKQDALIQPLEHYNFIFLQKEKINKFLFKDFCYHGYYLIANNILKNKEIDINKISNIFLNLVLNQYIE